MKRFLTGSDGFIGKPARGYGGQDIGSSATSAPAQGAWPLAQQGAWPLAQMVRDYWDALKVRGNGTLPLRSAIEPRAIAPALHSVFLASRVTMGLVRIRIGGTTLAGLAGIEVMDMPLSLLFVPEARPQLALAVERVLKEGAIATLDLAGEVSAGRPELGARLVLLPLLAADEDSVMVLGCLECTGEIGRAPRRFAVTRSRIEAGAAPAPARAAKAVVRNGAGIPAAALASPAPAPIAHDHDRHSEPPAPCPLPADRRERPAYLRLVHSV